MGKCSRPKKQTQRRIPRKVRERAYHLGADEIMNSASHELRFCPGVLRRVEKDYRKFCAATLWAMIRAARVDQKRLLATGWPVRAPERAA